MPGSNQEELHTLEVIKSSTGEHYIEYNGALFVKQKPTDDSVYGTIVKNGHQVTWVKGARSKKHLCRIVDNKVYFDDKVWKKPGS